MIDLGSKIDVELNRRVHALAGELRRLLGGRGGIDIVATYASLMVSYDPMALDFEDVASAARIACHSLPIGGGDVRLFRVPVVYGGAFGPDLGMVAESHGISQDAVIQLHANRDYLVFCMGFAPGFPFLGGLPGTLHTPRMESPRRSVPAGSVAIGGAQTGVYPSAMPGGWRLIGRTPLRLFDVTAEPPVPYGPGDVIRFEPIDGAEFERLRGRSEMPEPQAPPATQSSGESGET
jgi:KipI family sensor histidine kinase inhibitor